MGKLILGVLASGSGTNLKAIMDACASGQINARVAVVISDVKDAFALERARSAGIGSVYIDPKAAKDRSDLNSKIAEELKKHKVELVCMAGYMRLLGREVLDVFPGRVMNIHPSLLPSFKGANAVRDAYRYGVKVTGVTVHFADANFDTGPVILQRAVEILPGEDEEILLDKIHKVEHEIYPEAIGHFADGALRIEGRKVIIMPRRGQFDI